LGLKFAALGLAGVIWGMSFLASGTTIRTMSVPIEFSNVPPGMVVTGQSADTLEVQVRGSPWIMDSVNLPRLVGSFNLGGTQAGWHTLRLKPESLDLPPGIVVDRVTPDSIRVQVAVAQGKRLPGK
jgi:diadenylate cyclase